MRFGWLARTAFFVQAQGYLISPSFPESKLKPVTPTAESPRFRFFFAILSASADPGASLHVCGHEKFHRS